MQPKVDWNDAYRAGESAREVADAAWAEEPKRSNGPLVVACARDIKPKKVDWLWEQRLPVGKVVLVAGEGGLGKSMVLAWIASRISRAGTWPCGEGCSPLGSVIILSAEDDAADTIIPRLMAANADCSKVYILSAVRRDDEKGHRSFNLQLDLPELEKKVAEIGDVLVVIIDPITSYLGAVDSHRNANYGVSLSLLARWPLGSR
jgi:putative DNA primase/helicase